MNAKTRLSHIDIARGMLIVMLVMLHTLWVIRQWYSIDNTTINVITQYCNMPIYSFLMNGFFVITGFCTNWNQHFAKFIKRTTTTLLVPGILFTVIMSLVLTQSNCHEILESIILYGGSYWFLTALFLSKVLFWGIEHFANKLTTSTRKTWMLKTIAVLALTVAGVQIFQNLHEHNYWYICHTLTLTCSLAVGHALRYLDTRRTYLLAFPTFIVTLVFSYIFWNEPPIVTAQFNLTLSQIPVYWLLSSCGSITIIGIAKALVNFHILEIAGKHSLVVYLLHLSFLDVFVAALKPSLHHQSSTLFSLSLYLMAVSTTCLCCVIIASILSHKPFCLILGKWNV